MNKSKFYATYNGQCYVKGCGRKFYKRGIELIDITDCSGKIIIERTRKDLTKALEKCLELKSGTKIEFEAMLVENEISYISSVREINGKSIV